MCNYPPPVTIGMLKGVLDLVETGENLIIPDTILELLSKQFGQIRKADHIEVQLRLFDCNVDTVRSSAMPETRELCFV